MKTPSQRIIYISTGDTNGFYTLRVKTLIERPYGFSYVDHFIKNSSRDWDTAIEEATAIAKTQGARMGTKIDEMWDLNAWGSGKTAIKNISRFIEWKAWIDAGLMPFGKHKGTPFAEIPAGYRKWMRAEATQGDKCWDLLIAAIKPMEADDIALDAAEKAGREAEKAKSDWVGYPGDRTEAVITCISKIPYESRYYGGGFISILKDDKGNKLKTFGVCRIDKGETRKATFMVKKFEEFRGEKQTEIKNIKVK